LLKRWAKRIHGLFILFLILFLGCGEQNMVGLVPNIYLLQYLKSNAKVRKMCEKRCFQISSLWGFRILNLWQVRYPKSAQRKLRMYRTGCGFCCTFSGFNKETSEKRINSTYLLNGRSQ
jgi:hypothetical protein